ncbi:MAG TPA: Gfo/Idh/MocA family oxidoreductase [Actinomycetota bacterium]|nr:Gfo/Idh/MocA family oxidoreductase [Actinomycetota bacterium]
MTGAIVVGTGFGCLTHVRALRAAGFDVVGLVGRDPAKTKTRADRFEIANAFTSLDDALEQPGADAVTIATPPHTHAAIALAAIGAGKHVLVEKPFARDAAEARAMLQAAEQAGIVHLLGAEFRWAAGQALLNRVVREGAIGEPRLATFILHLPILADPSGELPEWWADGTQGGGWLGAHAPHVIDQVRVMLGEIEGVSAGLNLAAERDTTAEDSYTVHFRTESGVEGVMQSTAGAWGMPLFATRVTGSKGTARTEGDRVIVADAHGEHEVPLPEDLNASTFDPPPADLTQTAYERMHAFGVEMPLYTRLAQRFRDLIEGREVPAGPPHATFADGVAGMAVLDAIRQSAAERAWVGVDP